MMNVLAQASQSGQTFELKDWIPILSSVVTAIVAIVGIVVSNKTTRFVQEQNRQTERWKEEQSLKSEKRKEISTKLNDFYGPYSVLQEVAKKLSDIFRERRGQDFRTLMALLRGDKFEGNDRVLLEEILRINEARNELILKYGGLVDDQVLQELLWRASAHFRIIKLAYAANQEGGEGLQGDADRFEEYVYPNELNDRIRVQIQELQRELVELGRM